MLGFPFTVFLIVADCGKGYKLNRTSNTCEQCEIGSYQDRDWRDITPAANMMDPYITKCTECPSMTSTNGKGKMSENDCTGKHIKLANIKKLLKLFYVKHEEVTNHEIIPSHFIYFSVMSSW